MARPSLRAAAQWGRDVADPPRLVLAAKAAVAAAIAWYLAPLIPFADDEYSYYAPLGVLVSMYPTLARSARSGALALVGLAAGIALGIGGLLLVWADVAGIVAVALVVGVGVALGGIRALGSGRDWIAMAGLFTLLLGGASVEEFSVSYLVTMAFGVAVGVIVNLVVFPPLYLRRASERLGVLRAVVSGQLRSMAEDIREGSASEDRIARGLQNLQDTATAVGEEVREADESRRANPRARRHRGEPEWNARRLRALESTALRTRELADAYLGSGDHERDERTRLLLAEAMERTADLVDAPAQDPDATDLLEAARTASARLRQAVDERHATRPSDASHLLAAALCVERMIDGAEPFV